MTRQRRNLTVKFSFKFIIFPFDRRPGRRRAARKPPTNEEAAGNFKKKKKSPKPRSFETIVSSSKDHQVATCSCRPYHYVDDCDLVIFRLFFLCRVHYTQRATEMAENLKTCLSQQDNCRRV